MDRHDESFSPMKKQKGRAQRTSNDRYDGCPALTRVFESEDVLLHVALFVVLPLPYLCKVCAQQGGNSFTSAQIYALSRHNYYLKWKYCKINLDKTIHYEISFVYIVRLFFSGKICSNFYLILRSSSFCFFYAFSRFSISS